MRSLVLALVLLAGCAGIQRPSIESALRQVRAACELVGERDLDACAARLEREASK